MFIALAACQNPHPSGFVTLNDPDDFKCFSSTTYRYMGLGADLFLAVTLLVVTILGGRYDFVNNQFQGLLYLVAVGYGATAVTLFFLEKFGHVSCSAHATKS